VLGVAYMSELEVWLTRRQPFSSQVSKAFPRDL